MAYQVDVVVKSVATTLTLTPLSSQNLTTETRINLNNPQESTYSTVCVGGTLLERINYEGSMRRALFNQHSLFEERNSLQLQQRLLNSSCYITVSDSMSPPPIAFETVDLRSRMHFEIRPRLEGVSYFWIANGDDVLFVNTLTELLAVTIHLNGTSYVGSAPLLNYYQWHRLDFLTTYSGVGNDSVHVFLNDQLLSSYFVTDGVTHQFDAPAEGLNLTSLINMPIHFGSGREIAGNPFEGCIQNIVFETPASERLFPNLDFLSLFSSQRYSLNDSCFECSKSMSCSLNQVCCEPGYNREPLCADLPLSKNITCKL